MQKESSELNSFKILSNFTKQLKCKKYHPSLTRPKFYQSLQNNSNAKGIILA